MSNFIHSFPFSAHVEGVRAQTNEEAPAEVHAAEDKDVYKDEPAEVNATSFDFECQSPTFESSEAVCGKNWLTSS